MQQDEKEEKMWKVESSEKMQKNMWNLLDTKMIFPNYFFANDTYTL